MATLNISNVTCINVIQLSNVMQIMLKRTTCFIKYFKCQNRTINLQYNNEISDVFELHSELINTCQKSFGLPEYKVQSLLLRWPSFRKINDARLTTTLNYLTSIGFKKDDIIENPLILKYHCNTLKSRYKILIECGIEDINLHTLSRYVTLINKRTIKELKTQGFLLQNCDVWNKLKDSFSIWPEIQYKLINNTNYNEHNISQIRMEILQKVLFFKLNIPEKDFKRIYEVYVNIKHKSFESICTTINILCKTLNFSNDKFISHGGILTADPENIKMLFNEVKEAAGIDIKDIIHKFPGIILINYKNIMKIKEIYKKENIPIEAQKRAILLFSLSPETIQTRLDAIKSHPYLKQYMNNQRVLSLVQYYTKVIARLDLLQESNKKCSSLHKLVSHSEEFDKYIKGFGDKTKGVDFTKMLKNNLSLSGDIINEFKKHPYWINIPIHTIMENVDFLKIFFSIDEISENCQILFYPLENIKKELKLLGCFNGFSQQYISMQNSDDIIDINMSKLSKSQILSLLMYILEKNTNFTGNGVWND